MTTLARASFRWLVALAWASLTTGLALAQGDTRTERIQFKKGESSAAVTGQIKGYQSVDYLVGARKGQTANISLATKHTATYFNILAPGKTDEAFFNGSVSQNPFEGVLPDDGTYRIRVCMMRSAARRNETADYRLGWPSAVLGATQPRRRHRPPMPRWRALASMPPATCHVRWVEASQRGRARSASSAKARATAWSK